MRFTTRALILTAASAYVALGVLRFGLRHLPSQQAEYSVVLAGGFVPHSGGSVGSTRDLRYWSLEAGQAGSVSIGPFPAPEHLHFAVRSGAGDQPPEVFLQLEVTKDRLPVAWVARKEGWSTVDMELPLGWRGWRITLNAVSGPEPRRGDFMLSQPFGWDTGGPQDYGFLESLAAFLANGLLFGTLYVVAAQALAERRWVEPFWVPLCSSAVLGGAAYLVFWAFFASPVAGAAASAALFCTAGVVGIRRDRLIGSQDREWVFVAGLAALLGAFYLSVLYRFPAERDFYQLAANRFLVGMTGDNRLPFDFANHLFHGERPKELGAGWLSSDRPPLQEGWQLIAWPFTRAMGIPSDTASATAAVWLQLLWVFSFYGLVRAAGTSPVRAASWAAAAGLSGFFLVNTLFTWPKLCAGAYAGGAYGMWCMGPPRTSLVRRMAGGLFAALALLCHGGAAFSLLPLAAWAAWRVRKGEVYPWAAVGLALLLALAPWAAYQRYFAPPGNRLLKWHLAGQHEADARPFLRSLADAYGKLSWRQILAAKELNLSSQVSGGWFQALDWSSGGIPDRRDNEFYHTGRALGAWCLGFGFAAALGVSAWRRGTPGRVRPLGGLILWVAASMAIWCLLLYDGAIVHQGSYAVLIGAFAACALALDAAGKAWLGVMAVIQGYIFLATWWPASAVVMGRESVPAVAAVLLSAGACVFWLGWHRRRFSSSNAAIDFERKLARDRRPSVPTAQTEAREGVTIDGG